MKDVKKIVPLNTIGLIWAVIVLVIYGKGILTKDISTIIISLLIFLGYITFVKVLKRVSRKYASRSLYNPIFKVIELHVNDDANKDPNLFFKYCAEAILTAKENNKNVFFYTWHLGEKSLKIIFKDSITIVEPNRLDTFLNTCFSKQYKQMKRDNKKRKKSKVYYKCLVEVGKISDETLDKLKNKKEAI